MQPVNASTIQNNASTTIQRKAPELATRPATSSRNSGGKELQLPEDIVNLSSTSRSLTPTSLKSEKPSTQVTASEKESLLKASSGTMSFSTYV